MIVPDFGIHKDPKLGERVDLAELATWCQPAMHWKERSYTNAWFRIMSAIGTIL